MLRAEFPVLERCVYLNAGTYGPLPTAAIAAAVRSLEIQAGEGRTRAHFARRRELAERLRSAYAGLLGCAAESVALTTSTTDGIATVIAGLGLGPGDEILTSEEEHPGLLGALQAARDLDGASVRSVPWEELPTALSERTRLVACSHVGWMSGRILDPAPLRRPGVAILLDGAQGVGAVPVDVGALGVDFYAGSGQKWLCGPDGLGMLYVAPHALASVAARRRGYGSFADASGGLDAVLYDDARRFDAPALPAEALALGLASLEVLERAGWPEVHHRSAALAAQLADRLPDAGREVLPRDASTLVTFTSADPEGEAAALAERGIVVRSIPGRTWLRASVGAWNDTSDLNRLLEACSESPPH